MPNVKIFGFSSEDSIYYLRKRLKLEATIHNYLSNLPFANDAVITVVNSRCGDLRGNRTPYLEVGSSDSKHIEPIVKALEPLGYDIEAVVLHGFYPAKK